MNTSFFITHLARDGSPKKLNWPKGRAIASNKGQTLTPAAGSAQWASIKQHRKLDCPARQHSLSQDSRIDPFYAIYRGSRHI